MIEELDRVVLNDALPEHHLEPGDVGTVVLVHDGGYEVEFVTLGGDTVAVVSLTSSQVRPVGHNDITHVRTLRIA